MHHPVVTTIEDIKDHPKTAAMIHRTCNLVYQLGINRPDPLQTLQISGYLGAPSHFPPDSGWPPAGPYRWYIIQAG